MEKTIRFTMFLFVISLAGYAWAGNYDLNDGKTHLINDTVHQYDIIRLDYNSPMNPGTHLNIAGGAKTGPIIPYHSSSITIDGGIVDGYNVSIDTHGDNTIVVNGGSLLGDMAANNNSKIHVNSGYFRDDLYACDNGVVEIRGGSIDGILGVFDSGIIYLYGSNFMVGQNSLGYGDHLRDYLPQSPYPTAEYLKGVITGTLQDGSTLDATCSIWAPNSTCDIIIIPEPASVTLLLLGLGGILIRKR